MIEDGLVAVVKRACPTCELVVPVLAQRITYVGEYGYELYVARDDAVAVWDFLADAVRPEPVGYQALDSLRIEKGYRYFGTDLTASDTPSRKRWPSARS